MPKSVKADTKVIFALTLVHFIGDFYHSFIIPLFPVFIEKFSLNLTQVGLIAGISRILAFLVQPTMGYLADRYRTRVSVLVGALVTIVFIPLVGIAPGFLVLTLFIAFASIGSSMFHPTSAGMVWDYAGRNLGLSMSIFNMGGTLAFAAGPLFVTYVVGRYGLSATPLTMILGLAVMVILVRIVPSPRGQREGLKDFGFIGTLKDVLEGVWKSILFLWIIMVLRSFVSQSFLIFIPILLAKEGYSLLAIGKMVSLFTVAGAISGLLAGSLSDRVGYKPIFYIAHALTTPSLYLLLRVSDSWIYPAALIAGFMTMATLPLGLAMAQELAPRGRSMVSSLMMGLAFGTGGMMTPLTGKLADLYSIRSVLAVLAVIPLLTTALIVWLPEKKRDTGFSSTNKK